MSTLNEKEKALLRKMFAHPLFTSTVPEGFEKQIQSLENKINRKAVDKKAKIEPYTMTDIKGDKMTFSLGKGNTSVVLKFHKKEGVSYKSHLRLKWDNEQLVGLIHYLYGTVMAFYQDTIDMPYHKGYNEEFNVYENEVERSISIGPDGMSFICYTGDETDDDWTRISRTRLQEVVRLMTAYVFLDRQADILVPQLPTELQAFYDEWKALAATKELVLG